MEIGQKVAYLFYPNEDQTLPLEKVEATVVKVHENGSTVDLEFAFEETESHPAGTRAVTGVNPGTTGNTYQLPEKED